MKTVLASVAAAGLVLANPALAQSTRSGDAVPSASVAKLSRTSAPVSGASELAGRSSLLIVLFGILAAAGIAAAASGGGKDSPG